jgi:hypothetical protein
MMTEFEATYYRNRPHRTPSSEQLGRIDDHVLSDAITLRSNGAVPDRTLRLAGIPRLTDLVAERQRRGASRLEQAS